MPPLLLVTVDTELSNFPGGMGLWGHLGTEEWGLGRLIDVFGEQGVKATFFLDVYAGTASGQSEQRRAAELIVASGHDLQLHTHPAPSFDPTRPQLCNYSIREQQEIVEFGSQRITGWTGRRPNLHRAGDWAADDQSISALNKAGFRADFSASPWSKNCHIRSQAVFGNGWSQINGLLCAIGTCYLDRLSGRTRRLDLGGVSPMEVEDILSRRIDPLIVTLHSFSLLRYNRQRTQFAGDPAYLQRLRDFLERAQIKYGYSIVSASDAVAEQEQRAAVGLSWSPLPTTRTLASCAGLLQSAYQYISV